MNLPPTTMSQQPLNHQLVAMTALGGPALWMTDRLAESYKKLIETFQLQQSEGKDFERPLPLDLKMAGPAVSRLPIHPTPFVFTADSQSRQCEAVLDGESIPCFQIGGEKRLCLPQILKTVWQDFSLSVINQACDELHIYCSRSNPQQLEAFKRNGNIPTNAPTCGLITLTDAERLCSILLHGSTTARVQDELKRHQANEACIPVYHECFGVGYGYLQSDLYSSADARCVECRECGRLLSIKQFVGHCHSGEENRVCHWGFDRNNWRAYVMLDDDTLDTAECSRLRFALDDIVNRFADVRAPTPNRKRKGSCGSSPLLSPSDASPKSRRVAGSPAHNPAVETSASGLWLPSSHAHVSFPLAYSWPAVLPAQLTSRQADPVNTAAAVTTAATGSAMELTSPQVSSPPSLQNPESVVRSSETSRYEKHFIPNVALQQQADLPAEGAKRKGGLAKENRAEDPASRDGGVEKQLCVLDCLCHMESLFMKVLNTSSVSGAERDHLTEKYVSHSDAIRKCILSAEPE